MTTLEEQLTRKIHDAVLELYAVDVEKSQIQLQKTKKEFEGNLTLVVFPFVKAARKRPEDVAREIGEKLVGDIVERYNAVQGFLNLVISKHYWVETLQTLYHNLQEPAQTSADRLMMVEYSSPNTNKPLHLGHVRK